MVRPLRELVPPGVLVPDWGLGIRDDTPGVLLVGVEVEVFPFAGVLTGIVRFCVLCVL